MEYYCNFTEGYNLVKFYFGYRRIWLCAVLLSYITYTSFLTFGLLCNRKLCHFFNWQGLVQHLQTQRSEVEFKTPLLKARALF